MLNKILRNLKWQLHQKLKEDHIIVKQIDKLREDIKYFQNLKDH